MRFICAQVRILLLIQMLGLSLCKGQQDVIDVPLLPAPGYGPFPPELRLSYPGENGGPWSRAAAEVRGVPTDIHSFSLRYLNLQIDQYVYQSYRAGLIDPAFALDLIARNAWDTTKLTPKYVSQDVPIVAGIDREGNTVFVVDTKEDHSFWGKDRIVIPPFNARRLSTRQMDSLNALVDRSAVTFEFYDGNRMRDGTISVRICPYVKVPAERAEEMRGKIVFGIGTYEYRRGIFTSGGRHYMCAVSNGFQSGVYGGKEDEFAVFPAEDSNSVTPALCIRYHLGDRVELGNEVLRLSSVSIDGSSLRLRRENGNAPPEGIAIGAVAKDFEGTAINGQRVRLSRLKGRYVLLVFWIPVSSGCVADIPYLNDIHDAYGDSLVRIVGMVPRGETTLASFAAEHRIAWTQVVLEDSARVLRDYAVGGYPSTFLIDPQGKIVENRRLKGAELFNRLAVALADSSPLVSLISRGNVMFRCDEERGKSVEVEGDFSGWLPLPMYRRGGGYFRRVELRPGRYHYVFIVDGEWTLDPSNSSTEASSSGKTSNVLLVR